VCRTDKATYNVCYNLFYLARSARTALALASNTSLVINVADLASILSTLIMQRQTSSVIIILTDLVLLSAPSRATPPSTVYSLLAYLLSAHKDIGNTSTLTLYILV
jgi:hypothetical protein